MSTCCEPAPIQASGAPHISRRTSPLSSGKGFRNRCQLYQKYSWKLKIYLLHKARWRIAGRKTGPSPFITGFTLSMGYKCHYIQVTYFHVHSSSKMPLGTDSFGLQIHHVYRRVCGCAHPFTSTWRPQGSTFTTLCLVFRDRVSHRAWSSPMWLDWLAREPSGRPHWSRSESPRDSYASSLLTSSRELRSVQQVLYSESRLPMSGKSALGLGYETNFAWIMPVPSPRE